MALSIPVASLTVSTPAHAAAAGDLDRSFNVDGIARTSIGPSGDVAWAVAVQPDQKIVAAGSSSDFALARYDTDGTLDSSFGQSGKVTTPMGTGIDAALALAVQPDGKLVAAGYGSTGSGAEVDTVLALARYDTDGRLDQTFGTGGKVTTDLGDRSEAFDAVVILPDGRVLAAGHADMRSMPSDLSNVDYVLARYLPGGLLDPTFGDGGIVTTDFSEGDRANDLADELLLQPDGKTVAVGFSGNMFSLARYNTNGLLDESFDMDGKVRTYLPPAEALANAAVLQSDGKIVAGGSIGDPWNRDFGLIRYNPDGSIDDSFGTDGKVRTNLGPGSDMGRALVLQPDGKLFLAGESHDGNKWNFAVARYTAEGILDTQFSGDGWTVTDVGGGVDQAFGAALQNDGNLVVAGSSLRGPVGSSTSTYDFALVRYEGQTRDNPTARDEGTDFNGDGYPDLAVGVPGESIGSVSRAGLVQVQYGSPSGLTATGNQTWHQDIPGIQGASETGDGMGLDVAADDFNGDGYDDLATASPTETLGSYAGAGAVNVVYGSSSGLRAAGNQYWTQDSTGVPDAAESGDRFGSALATGDFDADGYADLAIGAASEKVGSASSAGAVTVLYGSPSGLTANRVKTLYQGQSGVLGASESADSFGSSIAAGDLNGDARDDLVIGAPGESVGSVAGAGAIVVLHGSIDGLSTQGSKLFYQGFAGTPGGSEKSDRFGASLDVGDINGDSQADLAVGIPGEAIGSTSSAGAVTILYGSTSGLSSTGAKVYYQGFSGTPGRSEKSDGFGSAVELGDFNGDGRADLTVGAPGESVGSTASAGAITTLYGTINGLTSSGAKVFYQAYAGLPGKAEKNDQFGAAFRAADFNRDSRSDLVVGVRGESVGADAGAGEVVLLSGSSSGLSSSGSKAWNQDTSAMLDSSEPDDGFGTALN